MPPAETETRDISFNQNDIVNDKKWCSSFPQTVSDDANSSKFMCRAMFVAFSTVIRYRKILGEECFKTNYITGRKKMLIGIFTDKLKIRSLSFENKESLSVSHLIRGASTALKDGVLEELALVITENEGDEEALEVFSWKMHYDMYENIISAQFTEGTSSIRQLASIKYTGTNSVRDQLVLLVRSIQVICQKLLQPLPENVKSCFRISYLPHTRPEYVVDGFKDSATFYKLSNDCQSAALGQLRPGHHASDLTCYSAFLADSYHAEMTLKRYADKLADSLGYDRPNTLYTSFLSNETSNTSLAAVTSRNTEEHEEAETLAKQVGKVHLGEEEIESQQTNSVESSSSAKSRRKRGNAADQELLDTPPMRTEGRTRYARVRSASQITPEKRKRNA